MKKELKQSIQILSLALILGLGSAYALGAWDMPESAPVGSNTAGPLHVGSSVQTKPGILHVENDLENATTSADSLTVFTTSILSGDASAGDEEMGTTNVDMHVTGKVGVNLDTPIEALWPTMALDVKGTARISSLDLSDNPGTNYSSARLCVDPEGILVTCPPPPPLAVATPTHTTDTNVWDWIVTPYHPTNAAKGSLCSRTYNFQETPTGGIAPYTIQWQTKRTAGGIWTNHASTLVLGAGSDGTTAEGTWFYRAVVTDSAGATATSTSSSLVADGVADPVVEFDYMNCV